MRLMLLLGALAALPFSCGAVETAPRNVILFLGDGLGISTITAARIHAGQLAGGSGEEHRLAFESFPNVALVRTYNVDRQVPDSAGSMSAIATGKPGRFGVLSVAPEVPRRDCAKALLNPLTTILERAEQAGLDTGIVTTTSITHATPAATYAHAPDRLWESDASVPVVATAQGCRDIARQLVEFDHGNGIEVMLGGGRQHFLPFGRLDPEYAWELGRRLDGRDLIAEWRQGGEGREAIWNLEQFEALDPGGTRAVLGLFEPSHMQYEGERLAGGPNEPSLAEMTAFAIRRLARNEQGYFLLVEGGRIDHAHHENNTARALGEVVSMDAAVRRSLELTDPAETLILVTADHSYTLVMAGYPPRGNPILGTIQPEGDEQTPYTTLSYINGPGYRSPLPDLMAVDTAHSDHRQFAGFPARSETHSGEDVAAFAYGRGAERLRGVIDQHHIHDVMAAALFGEEPND